MRTEINGVDNIEELKSNIAEVIVAAYDTYETDLTIKKNFGYREAYIYSQILKLQEINGKDRIYPITNEEATEFINDYYILISEIQTLKNSEIPKTKDEIKSILTSNYGFNINNIVDKWF